MGPPVPNEARVAAVRPCGQPDDPAIARPCTHARHSYHRCTYLHPIGIPLALGHSPRVYRTPELDEYLADGESDLIGMAWLAWQRGGDVDQADAVAIVVERGVWVELLDRTADIVITHPLAMSRFEDAGHTVTWLVGESAVASLVASDPETHQRLTRIARGWAFGRRRSLPGPVGQGDVDDFACCFCDTVVEVPTMASELRRWLSEAGLTPDEFRRVAHLAPSGIGLERGLREACGWPADRAAAAFEAMAGRFMVDPSSRGRWTVDRCVDCLVMMDLRARIRERDREATNGAPTSSRDRGIPASIRFRVLRRDGFTCVYCGQSQASGAVLHVDHFTPRARGGDDTEDNLVTACDRCNLGKGTVLIS